MTESERIALPLIEKLIVYRDGLKSRDDRELLADACNTISSLRATCSGLPAAIEARDKALERVKAAEDRIYDLLLGDDAQAYKEAQRYLEQHRPDLAAELRSHP